MTEASQISRRQFLTAASVGAAATFGLAATSTSASALTTSSLRRLSQVAKPTTITYTCWAGAAEEVAFKRLVSEFEAVNPKIKVVLDVVPYAQVLQDINARLQAGNAPDLFRVVYGDIGLYSSKQALLDLSPYMPADWKSQFNPAYYAAIEYNGKPYGIPHQTDTTVICYNKQVFAKAGIKSVPGSLATAWTWDEFIDVAKKVKAVQPKGKYAFMYDWAETGSYRWLTWLFEAGGNLLEKDLKTPAINSRAGIKTVEFTQSFFREGLVPPNTSTGNAVYPDSLFLAETVGMAFAADFLIPGDIATAKFPFGVTYQPRDVIASSDLGGTSIVATTQSKSPEAAALFLRFLASKKSMSTFCALTNELPTRLDLAGGDIPYGVDPGIMKTFVEQATTLTPYQVKQVSIPAFGSIETALQEQLDAAFTGGQSAASTVKNIAAAVTTAVSS